MKRAFYDTKPSVLEAVGNGSYLYRWDIQEETVTHESVENGEETFSGETRTQWSCHEVTVWAPVTANKILEATIAELIDRDREIKLINDYYAAQLGLFGGAKSSEEASAKIQAYSEYLTARTNLKAQVDADCEELGVPQN